MNEDEFEQQPFSSCLAASLKVLALSLFFPSLPFFLPSCSFGLRIIIRTLYQRKRERKRASFLLWRTVPVVENMSSSSHTQHSVLPLEVSCSVHWAQDQIPLAMSKRCMLRLWSALNLSMSAWRFGVSSLSHRRFGNSPCGCAPNF